MCIRDSLYGTGSAPLRWYEKCDKGLRARGFKSSRLDPCLYVSKHMIICLFVDDLVLVSNKQKHIDAFIKTLDDDGDKYNWEHTREGDLAEFLGIDINRSPDGKSFELLQKGLIKKTYKWLIPTDPLAKSLLQPAATASLYTPTRTAHPSPDHGPIEVSSDQ